MKVNRLGAQGGSAGDAASAVIDYLMGKTSEAETEAAKLLHEPQVDGEVAYYADAVEGPGEWLGQGARFWSLEGEVDETAFRNVLMGRHPHTGQRMLSARGSADRSHLRVGSFTALDEEGRAIYSVEDAAKALRMRPDDLTAYASIHDSQEMAATITNDPASLHAFSDGDSNQWVSEAELDRFEDHLISLRAATTLPASAKSTMSISEAAALVGVTPRYLNTIGKYYDDNRERIEAGELTNHAYLHTTFEPDKVLVAEPITIKDLAELAGVHGGTVWRAMEDGALSCIDDTKTTKGRAAKLIDPVSATDWLHARSKSTTTSRYVTRDELKRFVESRKQASMRIGYDLTLTTEKSFSVVAMLGDGDARDSFVQALDAGNAAAVDYLERTATWTRVSHTETAADGTKHQVSERVATEGLTVASFLHGTSRSLDPFLHRHNVVANQTVDANGDAKTLDARAFYRHAPAAAALGSAQMRADLTRKFGIRWVQAPSGSWEIDGVPQDTLDEFSQRSADIAEAVDQVSASMGDALSPEEELARRDNAAFQTRDEKLPTTRSEMVGDWRERAAATGLTSETIRACFGRENEVIDRLTPKQEQTLYRWLDSPTDGVIQSSTVFSRVDVIQQITRWWVPTDDGQRRLVVVDPAEVERQADRFLASQIVVPLDVGAVVSGDVIRRQDGTTLDNTHGERSFSTETALRRQAEVLSMCADRRTVDVGGCSIRKIAAVTDGSTLSAEQIALVTGFCVGGSRVRVAVGVAGAGKTFTLTSAREVWDAAGWKVMGATVASRAKQELSEAMPSKTLASLLTTWDKTGINPLDAKTVLVVDEAGTVSDRDLAGVVRMVEDAGAALRLIGDPAQHGSVQAGGLYRMLCEDESTIRLTTSRRVKHDVDRVAATLMRGDANADPAQALAMLKDAGHLIVTSSEAEAYAAVLTRWWDAHNDGIEHPIVEATNRIRLDLNTAAQHLRRTAGELGAERIEGTAGREFSTGDRVIAKINDKTLYPDGKPDLHITNGNTGVITSVDVDTGAMTVNFDGIGPLELPREYWGLRTSGQNANQVGLELGYSVTSHGVQGATLEQSTSLLTNRTTRAEAYVNMTRGEASNTFVLVERDDGEIEYLPAPEGGRALDAQIAANLDRDVDAPAIALDPEALDVHTIANGRTLARLHRGALRSSPDGDVAESHPLLHRAIVQRTEAVRAIAITDPPEEITEHLPPKPDQPHLARQWEQTVADVAVHQARWETKPTATAPWGHLLGPDRDSGPQHAERDRVVTALVELHVAMDLRHIRDTTPQPDVVAGTPLSQLGDTTSEGVDTEQLVVDATGNLEVATSAFDAARQHQRQLERTLAKLEDQNPGRRLRDRRLITETRNEHETAQRGTRTAKVDVDQAAQGLADAKAQHQRAANTLPTSPEITARTATLRRTTAAKPPPWATAHLADVRRSQAPLSVQEVATLHTEAAAYRERWDVDGDAPGLAGPRPDGPTTTPRIREWAALNRKDPVPATTADRVPTRTQERLLTR